MIIRIQVDLTSNGKKKLRELKLRKRFDIAEYICEYLHDDLNNVEKIDCNVTHNYQER